MIKKTVSLLIASILISTVTAFAAPSADFIFYDDTDGLCYVFGKFDKNADEAGVIIGGKKYSYKLDEADSDSRFRNTLEKDTPTFGIAFKAPRSYFNEFVTTPYSVSDNKDTYGITKNFGSKENNVKFDYLYYEDFSSGSLPDNMTKKGNKDQISIVQDGGNNKLKIADSGKDETNYVILDVPDYDDIITFEMRFKLTKTVTDLYGFKLYFLNDNNEHAFDIIKHDQEGSTLTFMNKGTDNNLMGKVDMDGVWYTLKVKMNNEFKMSDVSVENDIYKFEDITPSYDTYVWQDKENGRMISYNQSWIKDSSGKKIKKIWISTTTGTAVECLIDYVAFHKYDESYKQMRKRADSKEISTVEDPVIRLVPNKINILLNGEVCYSPYEPLVNNGIVFLEAETIADIFDMSYSETDDGYKLVKNSSTFEFKEESSEYYFNDKVKPISSNIIISEDLVYLPLCDIIKYLHAGSEFNEDKNILYINKYPSVDLSNWLIDNSQYEDVLTVYTLE